MSTYICIYNGFFSPHTNLPGFPSLQWSFKTSRQIISMLHHASIVQATDNTLNGSKRKSLPADSQGRCHLPDVWLSLLLTCLISTPSKESVLILQSRMCAVPIDSKWPLFRLNFYLVEWFSFIETCIYVENSNACHFAFQKKKNLCVYGLTFELQLQLFVSGIHNRQLGQHC